MAHVVFASTQQTPDRGSAVAHGRGPEKVFGGRHDDLSIVKGRRSTRPSRDRHEAGTVRKSPRSPPIARGRALGTIDELRAQATAFARPTGDRSSAWNQALRLGALRDDLRTRNADASVRAVARRAQSSPGRVGELLQAYDTFKDIVLLWGQEAEGVLYNLSFRSLRSVARIPSVFARMRELRRLSNVAQRSERPHHEGPGEHEDHP